MTFRGTDCAALQSHSPVPALVARADADAGGCAAADIAREVGEPVAVSLAHPAYPADPAYPGPARDQPTAYQPA